MYLDKHNLNILDMFIPLFHSMLPELYEERNIPVTNENGVSAMTVVGRTVWKRHTEAKEN
jgi:hypothetical protein